MYFDVLFYKIILIGLDRNLYGNVTLFGLASVLFAVFVNRV